MINSELKNIKKRVSNTLKVYLFGLKQEYHNEKKQHFIDKKVYKKINKNTPKNLDINLLSYQYFGCVDLLAIEGVSHATALAFRSEVGNSIRKFRTADQFASWLRFTPNNKISGGKILSSRIPKRSNRLKNSFKECRQCHWQFKRHSSFQFL